MKKFTKNEKFIPVSLIIMLLTGFNAIILNAQEISFTFTANYSCEYADLDSILIENLTQGVDTTLYYPDTMLNIALTGIDQFLTGSNNFYVSQNYPNPFETKTNIDVFLPECDNITIDVYDLLGRKVANYEGTLESGLQHFTFFGGNSKNYILIVSSKKYWQYIQMIQSGEISNGVPYLEYNGLTTMKSMGIKQKSLQSLFSYNLGDQLRFTGYVSGDYASITDNPVESHSYIFNINNTITYDGITYNTIKIGTQCWFKENLRTTKYNDGTSITNVTDNATWTSTTSGAYCCYSNNTSNCTTYGALYNWYAVNTGKLCPSGWHVPSDAEWTTLTNYLSANSTYWCGSNSSYIAKSLASTTSWNSSTTTCAVGNNLSANNSTGFSALPGGGRDDSDGSFVDLGYYGYWWSSSETVGSLAWFRYLGYDYAHVDRDGISLRLGFSVRCLRD